MITVQVTREDGKTQTLEGEQAITVCFDAALFWALMDGWLPEKQEIRFEFKGRPYRIIVKKKELESYNAAFNGRIPSADEVGQGRPQETCR